MTTIQISIMIMSVLLLTALGIWIESRMKIVEDTITLTELMQIADYDHATGLWVDKSGKCYELISKDEADEGLYREAEYGEYEHMTALHSPIDDKHGSWK